MKKAPVACVVAFLAACSQSEQASDGGIDTARKAEVLGPGVYEYARSDGLRGIRTISEDGTFSGARSDGAIETGTWITDGGLICFTSEGNDESRQCLTFARGDRDGKLTGSGEDGRTVEMRLIE